jgi:hypothetical protein
MPFLLPFLILAQYEFGFVSAFQGISRLGEKQLQTSETPTSMDTNFSHNNLQRNKKLSPITGREFDLTRFHPNCMLTLIQHTTLKLLTEQPVSLTLFRFQGHAREWFSVIVS